MACCAHGLAHPRPCSAPSSLLRLDHVIVAVRDLHATSARFQALGFSLKPGRLHADSLINTHIKLRDGRELELMSLAGTPTDATAREYARLLADGDRGAFVALRTDSLEVIRRRAVQLGLSVSTVRLGPWTILKFSEAKGVAPLFVLSGGRPVVDPNSVLNHENGAIALESAWIEAGQLLERFLLASGCRACGTGRIGNGREGTRWALGSGSLVVVRPRTDSRVIGVELRRRAGGPSPIIVEPVPDFRILLH